METKNNLEKYLFQLTTEEFDSIIRIVLREIIPELVNAGIKQHQEDLSLGNSDLIRIDDVIKLTGYSKATIYAKVSFNAIPIISRGKPLMFSKKALEEWIIKGKPTMTEQLVAKDLIIPLKKRKRRC